jgi:hypothetical protein
MSKAETTDSTPASDGSPWPLGDMEPALHDLEGSIGVLRHLTNPDLDVNEDEWLSVIATAGSAAETIRALW